MSYKLIKIYLWIWNVIKHYLWNIFNGLVFWCVCFCNVLGPSPESTIKPLRPVCTPVWCAMKHCLHLKQNLIRAAVGRRSTTLLTKKKWNWPPTLQTVRPKGFNCDSWLCGGFMLFVLFVLCVYLEEWKRCIYNNTYFSLL